MQFVKLAKINDFRHKNIKSFTIIGKKISIIKRKDGSFFATEVGCKHQGADLTKGEIRDYIATCHRHHWKFNLITGECLNHESPPLRKHDVEVRGEEIYVSIAPMDKGDKT